MATIKQAITLSHQPSLGNDVQSVDFAEGDEVTILKEWEGHYLCRNGDGLLFNIAKDLVAE